MRSMICFACGWLGLACSSLSSAADERIFRAGDEIVVRLPNADQLRSQHRRLPTTLRLRGPGGERAFQFDWADRAFPESIVVETAPSEAWTAVEVDVRDATGRTVHAHQAAPIAEVPVDDVAPSPGSATAAIEIGSQLPQGPAPRIVLPERSALRVESPGRPARSVSSTEITYPVVAEVDLPIPSSVNAVVVSRQSFAPDDATKCSLYFSYRKGLFDSTTSRLKGYRKMLVEVPLDGRWMEGADDRVVTLPADGFAIHTTDEREIGSTRWDSAEGYNMLGGSSTGLYQGGSTVDVDEQGRIYVTNVPDGAGIVRFNPHTRRFEQPPLNFHAECRKFLPTEAPWRRSWDADLAQVVCTRGRVYLVFDRHYRVTTPNGKFETCSGVVSVPQDHWDDAEAFRRDIRLHAGCWPQATPSLYADDVVEGSPRRAGAPVATRHGIAFGSWRLDLDDQGHGLRLAKVNGLADSKAADGSAIEPTEIVKVRGLPHGRLINVGAAGRAFVAAEYGEFRITRAALGLTLPGAPEEHLVDAAGKYRSTYPGAPAGTLTVRYDIAGKMLAERTKYATLAAAMSGVSQGPNYGVIALPGEADQALGVCEYGYYLSKLDFSRRASQRKVFRSYLPLKSGDQATALPVSLGLGPYNLAWAEHDGARWLYSTGYTGLGRLKYAVEGRALDAFEQEIIHRRLEPRPIDAAPRDAVKDYLHVLPALGGKLIDIGRGRPGRGGGAYSAGLEWFDPSTLGPSRTAVAMNRCYGLYTPVSRVVFSTRAPRPRQEIYVAGGEIRPEYVADLADPALRPRDPSPKVFVYGCDAASGPADLFGFSLPGSSDTGRAAHLAFSRCRRFLIVLQADGTLHTFDATRRRFVDGVRLQTATGGAPRLLTFDRPTAWLWSSPDGRTFLACTDDGSEKEVRYLEAIASPSGRLEILPHLAVRCDGTESPAAFEEVVRAFLPDLARGDGSYDLVLGVSRENGGQPVVRVIDDFIPPAP